MNYQYDYSNTRVRFYHIVHRKCKSTWGFSGINEGSNLILVYKGKAYVQSGHEKGKIVSAGDLVYFPKGVYRKAYTFKEDLMQCYAISFNLFAEDVGNPDQKTIELPLDFIQKINDTYTFEQLRMLVSNMVKTWDRDDAYKNYDLNSLFYHLLKVLLKWQTNQHYNYEKANKVYQLIEYMKLHLQEKVSIRELCAVIGVSNSYISRIFKEVTGKTIMDYFNQLKINQSKMYLEQGYSVSECTKLLGFSDIYYFSKLFKQYENISPSKYKNRLI